MKKKPFLLLEILIALALVLLAAAPLIVQPIHLYKAELKLLEQTEGERLADWTFSEIKESLLKNEIPWEAIPSKRTTSSPFSLAPVTLQIPGIHPKSIERSFTLFCKAEKKGLQGETYRLLYVNLSFSPHLCPRKKDQKAPDYKYKISVQRIPRQQKTTGA
jgi:hypothetical protein